MADQRPIGVFDSGVGGISVLRELVRALPEEKFVYYGDGANAPYGVKSTAEVIALCEKVADFLLGKGVKAIVIACNTATAASLPVLQEKCPVPVIGIEPAVALGNTLRKEGKVLAMATPGTIASDRFAGILAAHGAHCIPMPCPGLMEFVERGETESEALHMYFDALLEGVDRESVDVAVLGCTHYPFVRKALSAHLPDKCVFVDGSMKTLRELQASLAAKDAYAAPGSEGGLEMYSSAGAESIKMMEMLLRLP